MAHLTGSEAAMGSDESATSEMVSPAARPRGAEARAPPASAVLRRKSRLLMDALSNMPA
jgi:hypothetical protein